MVKHHVDMDFAKKPYEITIYLAPRGNHNRVMTALNKRNATDPPFFF